jgi:hypothetical protein
MAHSAYPRLLETTLVGSRERIEHKQPTADSLTGVGSPSRNNILPTRNQEEGPPSRIVPSAATVAGTKTGRKKVRSQEVANQLNLSHGNQ